MTDRPPKHCRISIGAAESTRHSHLLTLTNGCMYRTQAQLYLRIAAYGLGVFGAVAAYRLFFATTYMIVLAGMAGCYWYYISWLAYVRWLAEHSYIKDIVERELMSESVFKRRMGCAR